MSEPEPFPSYKTVILFQTAQPAPLTPSIEPWSLWDRQTVAEGQIDLRSYSLSILCFSK